MTSQVPSDCYTIRLTCLSARCFQNIGIIKHSLIQAGCVCWCSVLLACFTVNYTAGECARTFLELAIEHNHFCCVLQEYGEFQCLLQCMRAGAPVANGHAHLQHHGHVSTRLAPKLQRPGPEPLITHLCHVLVVKQCPTGIMTNTRALVGRKVCVAGRLRHAIIIDEIF